MGKHRSQTDAKDIAAAWERRGYRADSIDERDDAEDHQGETAYQKAFHEASKLKPPRYPDPERYPNSTSAKRFKEQRDQKLFPGKPGSTKRPPPRNDNDSPGLPSHLNRHRQTLEGSQLRSTGSSPSQSYHLYNNAPSPHSYSEPSSAVRHDFDRHQLDPRMTTTSSSSSDGRFPSHLEPKAAPAGPRNPFDRHR